jgi:hypothetical protein
LKSRQGNALRNAVAVMVAAFWFSRGFLMHPSLDPEIFMAKLLCKLSGTEPEALIPGGHDETGAYYPNFARSHLYDR